MHPWRSGWGGVLPVIEGRVVVLCRPASAAGFALAGLQPLEVQDASEATRKLESLLADAGLGILLIESGLYDALEDEARRHISSRVLPLVIPFPGPAWATRAAATDAYVVELLRRAIGYQVRLR
jgi:vacuolar-type H+-ATPase subunit F/Vma7